MTIIAGHTRWYAAQKLALEVVPIHIANLGERDAAALRLLDNRSGEVTNWKVEELESQVTLLEDQLGEDIRIWFDEDYFAGEDLGSFSDAAEVLAREIPVPAESLAEHLPKVISSVRVGPVKFQMDASFINGRVKEWEAATNGSMTQLRVCLLRQLGVVV